MRTLMILLLMLSILLSGCTAAEDSWQPSASEPSFKISPESGTMAEHPSSCEPPVPEDEPSALSTLPRYMPLEQLPEDYSTASALSDGVVCAGHSAVEGNGERIPEFFREISQNHPAMLRIRVHTIEGDPIYYDLEFLPEENCFLLRTDSTRDAFSSERSISSCRFAYLRIQSQPENPESAYLMLSHWRDISSMPEGTYDFPLLPLNTELWEAAAVWEEAFQQQYSETHTAVQRVFFPDGSMEAQLLEDGSITVSTAAQRWNISGDALSYDGTAIVFDRLEWNEEGWLLLKKGDSTVQIYDPAAKQFILAVCTGVPLV